MKRISIAVLDELEASRNDDSPDWRDWTADKQSRETFNVPELRELHEEGVRMWQQVRESVTSTVSSVVPDCGEYPGKRDFVAFLALLANLSNMRLDELYRMDWATIQGLAKAYNIAFPANRDEGDTIPPEYQTKPMSMVEAARKLGYSTNHAEDEAGSKLVKRSIQRGTLRAVKVSARKFRFDSRQVK
jgi:hypothetical protein